MGAEQFPRPPKSTKEQLLEHIVNNELSNTENVPISDLAYYGAKAIRLMYELSK